MKKTEFLFLSIFISLLLTNQRVDSSTIPVKLKLISEISAVDVSCLLNFSYVCTNEGEIYKYYPKGKSVNLEVYSKVSLMRLPTCKKLAVTTNEDIFIISDTEELHVYKNGKGTFNIESLKFKARDVSSGVNGETYAISTANELLKFDTSNGEFQIILKLPVEYNRIAVGMTKEGKTRLYLIDSAFGLDEYGITDGKLQKIKTHDIYATDVAVSENNRVYVATTLYGSFVQSSKVQENEFNNIANLGVGIGVGQDLMIISKNKRLLISDGVSIKTIEDS